MSWQDQGRQEHGWFGHGTSSASDVSAARETAAKIAYSAYGHLPAAQRGSYERWLDHGGLHQVAAVLPAWAAGAHLSEDRFRSVMFGPQVSEEVAARAHAVGLTLALARVRTPPTVAAAGRRFAGLVMAARPERMGRIMADAATQASTARIHNFTKGAIAKPAGSKSNGDTVLAELKCDGVSSGCQSGGSYGSSAMYNIFGRNLCRSCAVKSLGLQDEPGAIQSETLKEYLIRA